jgi:hypothetical protein
MMTILDFFRILLTLELPKKSQAGLAYTTADPNDYGFFE